MQNFWSWWQHLPQNISPYILQTEYFSLHYYGLMYVIAFVVVFVLLQYRIKNEDFSYDTEFLLDLFIWAILGIIIGGRLGYVIFYNLPFYISHPIQIISPFGFVGGQLKLVGISGMSYHGGLIGVLLSSWWFCRKKNINFLKLADFIVPAVPLGYTFGRIGNFINGELYGKITSVKWGMYFSQAEINLRHPSQLYEAFFEGVFIFTVLWLLRKKEYFDGFFLSLYLILYAVVRFFVEFFRTPDPQLGKILGVLTMGQILSIIMLTVGIWLYFFRKPNR